MGAWRVALHRSSPPPRRGPACALALAWAASCAAPAREPVPTTPRAGPQGSEPASVEGPQDTAEPASTSDGSTTTPALPAAEGEGSFVHGSLVSRYRGRWTDGDDDHDLFEVLALDFGDPERDPVTGHFMGRFAIDLDGSSGGAFFSLDDTYDDALVPHVYLAHADFHAVPFLDSLRLGRQSLYRTPAYALFDGLSFETALAGEHGPRFGAYGGLAASLYESRSDDLLGGAYLEFRLWPGSRARFDWMHLEDELRLGPEADELLGVELGQDLGASVHVSGKYTALEGEDRDLRLQANYQGLTNDLTVRASHYRLFEPEGQLALEIDPYFDTLFDYFPFDQSQLVVAKGIGEDVVLEGGLDVRRVSDSGDLNEFNQDFERYYLTSRFGLPAGLTLALTGDLWLSDQTDVDSWGIDLSKDIARLELSLGSYYSLFKYDLQTAEMQNDVRTYYVRLRRPSEHGVVTDVRYEVEDDDFALYHGLWVTVTWSF